MGFAFETLNCRDRYFITFLKLHPKCTSLQVKVVLEYCTLLQVTSGSKTSTQEK